MYKRQVTQRITGGNNIIVGTDDWNNATLDAGGNDLRKKGTYTISGESVRVTNRAQNLSLIHIFTTQGQWMPAVREACAYLDSITFGRLKCGAPVDDTVKLAACALADVAARYQAAKADERSRPGLAAFNTDGYSETLNTAALTAQYTADMQAAADIYLPRSHPLRYAGRDGRCRPCTAVTRP